MAYTELFLMPTPSFHLLPRIITRTGRNGRFAIHFTLYLAVLHVIMFRLLDISKF